MSKFRIIKKAYSILLLLVALLLIPSVSTQAASAKNTWKEKDGYFYYWDKNGKMATGFKKIGKEYYLFDSKGRQQTGWRKTGSIYRFFNTYNGKKGKMIRSKVINGIQLTSGGRAVVTNGNSKKLALMVSYRILADQLTIPSQSVLEKKRICYDYIKTFPEHPISSSYLYTDDWDVRYAEYAINNRNGDCYGRACAFAYLANAVGVREVKCINSRNSGNDGHGWTEINGKIYDPSFEHHYPSSSFYGLTYRKAPQYNITFFSTTV